MKFINSLLLLSILLNFFSICNAEENSIIYKDSKSNQSITFFKDGTGKWSNPKKSGTFSYTIISNIIAHCTSSEDICMDGLYDMEGEINNDIYVKEFYFNFNQGDVNPNYFVDDYPVTLGKIFDGRPEDMTILAFNPSLKIDRSTIQFVKEEVVEDEEVGSYNVNSKVHVISNLEIANNQELWVDMGIKSDDGKTLYWAKGDIVIQEDGTTNLAVEGLLGTTVVWGDITGRIRGKANLSECGGTTPKSNICGDPKYDIVTARLGTSTRLPSAKEFQKLFENCTSREGSFNVELPEFILGNYPSWLQGQWMRDLNVNGKVYSETFKFDGILVNILRSFSGINKVIYEGYYSVNGKELKINGTTYYIDNEKKSLKSADGIAFRHISKESSYSKAYGTLLKSNINGNKLFFPYKAPTSTYQIGNGVFATVDNTQESYFWSGNVYEKDTEVAYILGFIGHDGFGLMAKPRNETLYARPVLVK